MKIIAPYAFNKNIQIDINYFKNSFFAKEFYLYLNSYYNKILIGENIMLEQYLPFMGLIVFGNIENLILSSQGVVEGVDPKILGGLSILVVIAWLIIGTVLTDLAIQYANYINFIGGLAIFILGVQAVYEAVKDIRSKGGA